MHVLVHGCSVWVCHIHPKFCLGETQQNTTADSQTSPLSAPIEGQKETRLPRAELGAERSVPEEPDVPPRVQTQVCSSWYSKSLQRSGTQVRENSALED